jgi:7,8-dihydroneopterin aldolase/epimerase/oxygenase
VTDTVSIKDLRVSAVIGVHDWERDTEQILIFGVDMATDVAATAAKDNIAAALDYSAVAQTVRTVVMDGKFQLIETAAERVAERLRSQYGLGWVRVQVAKPLQGEGYTAVVTIERGSRLTGLTGLQRGASRDVAGHDVADVSMHSGPPSCQDE